MFLLKERAKLHRQPQERKSFKLCKRLSRDVAASDDSKHAASHAEKRLNMGGGQWAKPQDKKGEGQ